MRPTDIGIRHPRERTPDPIPVAITFDGRRASFDS
jgi:hypothetical protein